jgi:putative tricarboxylic transport membrane protein
MTTTTHSTQSRTPEGRARVALAGEMTLPAILIALGIFVAVNTATMSVIGDAAPGPKFFPTIIAILLLGTGTAMAIIAVVRHRRQPTSAASDAQVGSDFKTLGIVVAALAVFIVVMPFAGWLLSAAALFFTLCGALGSRAHGKNILIALTFSALLQIAFSIGLGLNLPTGVIGAISSWIS